MHIVTVVDDRFAGALAVMLGSLLENKLSAYSVAIYIIDGGISNHHREKLIKSVERHDTNVRFLEANPLIYSDLAGWGDDLNKFYRISIPDLLDRSIPKALYLDSDLIIREDITALWNHNIDGYFLAAVKDAGLGYSRHRELSIPLGCNYFNSGVMLMNLSKWRAYDVSNMIIDYIIDHPSKLEYYDQDALNAVLCKKWLEVEPRWNYTTGMASLFHLDPAIIHYTGYHKPWLPANPEQHPWREEYFKYAEKTAWV